MNETRDHDRSDADQDQLTRLLRQADPAADDSRLGPVDTARMRQTIARAAEHASAGGMRAGGRQGWMTPAIAAAAIAVVALGAWLIGGGSSTAPAEVVKSLTTPDTASDPIDRGTPPAAEIAPVTEGSVAEAVPGVGDTADLVAAPDPETAPAGSENAPDRPATTVTSSSVDAEPAAGSTTIAAVDSSSPSTKQARTVQFTAPRGTRIVWTLDPNFESPIAGQEPRQEQS